jgi:hypothetical protein
MEKEFVPIKLVSVVTEEVGSPRNDGTAGGALYTIPIKLSASPRDEWRIFFLEAFDDPPQRDTAHRRGIASFREGRIILDGTTMEELETTHVATLKLAVEQANRKYADLLAHRRATSERQRQDEEKHRKSVEESAKKIKFD